MRKIFSKNLAIAVDVGGTNSRVNLIDRQGRILRKTETKTAQKGRSGRVVSDQIVSKIRELVPRDDFQKISGIGVSGAGPQDCQKGSIVGAPNMPFREVPVKEILEKEFGIPVFLINDANAGALGEKCFGIGKKGRIQNLVYITISSGIGGGAVIDGNLLFGKSGNAAEIGHMYVGSEHNLLCSCKKGRGHWEGYASGNNLPKFFRFWARKKGLKGKFPSSAKEIFDLARKKNEIALNFMKELGRINGAGFSNVIAAYDPETIILGGAVALNNFDLIVKYAKPNIDRFLKLPKIKKSVLGENTPLLGAAATVFLRNIDKKDR